MIIDEIYRDKRFIQVCRGITKGSDLADDLLQHCAILLYERGFVPDKDKGNLFDYFSMTALNQWRMPSSKFNKEYKVHKEIPSGLNIKVTDDQSQNNFLQFLDKSLEEIPKSKRRKFAQSIFLVYLKLGSIRAVSLETGIDQNLVTSTIKFYKTQIEHEYRLTNLID